MKTVFKIVGIIIALLIIFPGLCLIAGYASLFLISLLGISVKYTIWRAFFVGLAECIVANIFPVKVEINK